MKRKIGIPVQNDLVDLVCGALVDLAFADHRGGRRLRNKAVANICHRDIEVAVVLLIDLGNDLVDFAQVHTLQVLTHSGVAF